MDIQTILKLPQMENLTGGQVVEVLDTFLNSAIEGIFSKTNLGKRCCADIMSQLQANKRRKLSTLDKKGVICCLYNTIVSPNKSCFDSYKTSKMERTISFRLLCLFLDYLKNYDEQESEGAINKRQLDKIDCSIKYAGITYWKALAHQKLYLAFKEKVMQKYYLLAYKQTISRYNMCSHTQIDIDDLFKTMVIAISSGIDKYREDKGSLSSFIQWQFKHYLLNPGFDYEYGSSYSINKTLKLDISKGKDLGINNFAYEIDEAAKQIPMESNTVDENIDVKSFISKVKNIKDVRFALEVLGLNEYL